MDFASPAHLVTLSWHRAPAAFVIAPEPGEHPVVVLVDALQSPWDAELGEEQARGCVSPAGQTPHQSSFHHCLKPPVSPLPVP